MFELPNYITHNFFHIFINTCTKFSCVICDKGNQCKTFNILHGDSIEEGLANKDKGDYETFGYGNDHMPKLEETEYSE